MVTGDDSFLNMARADSLLRRAAQAGVKLAVLPENTFFMGTEPAQILAQAKPLDEDHPWIAFLSARSRELDLWIVAVLPVESEIPGRVHNTAIVIDDKGELVADYHKIHLFDVDLPGDIHKESAVMAPGHRAVVVPTPWGNLGLTVCYDLRFPALYQHLRRLGADIIVVPSAFTRTTTRAHWELLIRARAIENQCLVIAPNQAGTHPGNRHTGGHSMVVDAWGRVLGEGDEENEGVITAIFDPIEQSDIRRRMPVLEHRGLFDDTGAQG